MEPNKDIFKFKSLPEIKGNVSDLSSIFSKDDTLRLLSHESMRYYNLNLDSDKGNFILSENIATRVRAELILPTIKELIDKSTGDVTVLDLACSPGYFMFKIVDLEVKSITGVDARQIHADQFKIINHFYGYKNINFVHSDMYLFLQNEIAKGNKYDICLLFGFLYHTSTPVELLRMIRKICKSYLIIDTTLNSRDDNSILIYAENTEWSRASTSKISFNPSFNAVPLMAEAAGFSKTEFIKPSKELEPLNPGGDNVNYYFHSQNTLANKFSKFPTIKQIIDLTSNRLKSKSNVIGARRAYYISYV